jgi:hypothetical protein
MDCGRAPRHEKQTDVSGDKYPVPTGRNDHTIRAFFEDTLAHSKAGKPPIDVRLPGEFKGEITLSKPGP